VVRTVGLLARERLGLAIVYVLPPLDARVLEPLAARLAELGGAA
jgi:hypothetical protein